METAAIYFDDLPLSRKWGFSTWYTVELPEGIPGFVGEEVNSAINLPVKDVCLLVTWYCRDAVGHIKMQKKTKMKLS